MDEKLAIRLRSEEELLKMSCKELKKIARHSNVNPNFRKAELVKALLSSCGSVPTDKTEHANMSRIMTRSRASIFPSLNIITDPNNEHDYLSKTITQDSDISLDKEANSTTNPHKHPAKERKQEWEPQNRSINTSSFDTSEVFLVVSSVNTQAQPLQEITNKNILPQEDSELTTQNNCKKTTKGRKKGVHNDLFLRLEFNPEVHPESDRTQETSKEADSNSKVVDKSKKKPRRQKKKREVEENNMNFESNENQLSIEKSIVDGLRNNINNNQNLTSNALEMEIESGKIGEESIPHESFERSTRCDVVKPKRRRKKEQGIALDQDESASDCNNKGNLRDNVNLPQEETVLSLKSLSSTPKSNDKKKKKIPDAERQNATTCNLPQEEQTFLSFDDGENDPHSSRKDRNNTTPQTLTMPVPVRSSTFVLDDEDKNKTQQPTTMPVAVRSNTFILEDDEATHNTGNTPTPKDNKFDLGKPSNGYLFEEKDKSSPGRASFRFYPAPDLQVKNSPSRNPQKNEKSIGKRILTASTKKEYSKLPSRQTSSSLKKAIVKSTATPGSAYRSKFRVVRKLPNFKAIHQKLFNNMESLGDNTKRRVERAQALLQSPVVPRCAFTVKNQADQQLVASVNSRTALLPKDDQVLKPSTTKTQMSNISLNPGTKNSPVTIKKNAVETTPRLNKKPEVGKTPLNRFGFKNPIKKSEAKNIIVNKLPTLDLEKKKEKERSFLQGVRTNKRFMLQMKMRQEQQGSS